MTEARPYHGTVTRLLHLWRKGDEDALDHLMQRTYKDLKRIAGQLLKKEVQRHLTPTLIVHEAFGDLLKQAEVEWRDRKHFYNVCSKIFGHIIVEEARRLKARKRGGGEAVHIRFDGEQEMIAPFPEPENILSVQAALDKFTAVDGDAAFIVALRFYLGLTISEIAEVTCLSEATVKRKWAAAKIWLTHDMKEKSDPRL